MSWLKKVYKKHIYAVMGTLVFHILLISCFLLADVDIKGKMKEPPIIIELPDILPEQEKTTEDKQPAKPEKQANENTEMITNRASNRSAISRDDKFFNQDYQNEIKAARKLVSDVNRQLQKKIISINDIKMPVDNTEGIRPDSVKNVIYTGKSNISYELKNRYHINLPIPVYLAQGGGKVVVDIVVNQQGEVIKVSSRKNSEITDQQVYYYAELAARHTTFNADPSAPLLQSGTITYNFVAQ